MPEGRARCVLCMPPPHSVLCMQAGDQVRVVAGMHSGQTGMVLKIDPDTHVAVLLSDATQEELQALSMHLSRATATTAALDT